MMQRLIFAGSGGQGLMLLGKILAQAAMLEGKFVTWFPSYGAEVRGGTAHCMVTISDKEIGSPYIAETDVLVAMNQLSLMKFKERLIKGGLLLLNSSLTNPLLVKTGKSFPFSEIALELGNIKVANILCLGSLLALKKTVKLNTVKKVMERLASSKEILQLNLKALAKGVSLVNG